MLGLPDGAFNAPGLAHDPGRFKENLMLIITLIKTREAATFDAYFRFAREATFLAA